MRRMSRPSLGLIVLLAGCHVASPPASDAPDGGPAVERCGAAVCAAEESCLALLAAPTAPACVAHDDCHAVPPGLDLVAQALAAVGRTRCDAQLPEDFLGAGAPEGVKNDPWRLAHYAPIHHEPLRLPGWSDRLVAALGRPREPQATSRAIAEAARRLGVVVATRRPAYAPAPVSPLARAVEDLSLRRGGLLREGEVEADAADIPVALQQKLATVVMALDAAAQARDAAFAKVADLETLYAQAPSLVLTSTQQLDPSKPDVRAMLVHGIDWQALYQGAYDLAAAVEDAGLASEAGASGFAFDQPTPLGRIVFGDAGAQTYDDAQGPIALVVDFGGNDTYRGAAGGTEGVAMAAALVVDLGGDDTYGYREVPLASDAGRLPSDDGGRVARGGLAGQSMSDHPRQGAGRCGIGMAFDYAGNDHYRSLRMSQGFGALGVGVLFDGGGDDTYEAEAGAQGAALLGIGLQLDAGGNDTRRIYSFGQGFGYSGGFGALVDEGGDDAYLANGGNPEEGGDPLYPSAQLPGTGNTSFVQGASFGRRDDTGASAMSGGIGVLADLGPGSDRYEASVFAQGAGYWFGTGVLFDEAGDDHYDGKWYVQGAAAHFALASFHDKAGNDHHNEGRNSIAATSLGVGHDWSVAFLVDDAGNDTYVGPGLSLGAGNACGWGVLADGGGDDTYRSPGTTMGAFGDPINCSYAHGATVGLLVDAGGTDTYEIGGKAQERSDRVTPAVAQASAPDARAAAVDGVGALLLLP